MKKIAILAVVLLLLVGCGEKEIAFANYVWHANDQSEVSLYFEQEQDKIQAYLDVNGVSQPLQMQITGQDADKMILSTQDGACVITLSLEDNYDQATVQMGDNTYDLLKEKDK